MDNFYYEKLHENIICFKRESTEQYDSTFHFHNGLEIYLYLQGDINFFVEQTLYSLKRGSILIFNEHELHKAVILSSEKYERVVINFNPKIIGDYSTKVTDLLKCFYKRDKGKNNAILLSKKQLDTYTSLANKLLNTPEDNEYGNDTLRITYLVQILVFINKLYNNEDILLEQTPLSEILQEVIKYIDSNIALYLTLEGIAEHFSISVNYLGKLFKKETGLTVYNYVLHKKIALAKQCLLDGKNVSETCAICGFNDYSNFIRTFRQISGVSPTKYLKKNSRI